MYKKIITMVVAMSILMVGCGKSEEVKPTTKTGVSVTEATMSEVAEPTGEATEGEETAVEANTAETTGTEDFFAELYEDKTVETEDFFADLYEDTSDDVVEAIEAPTEETTSATADDADVAPGGDNVQYATRDSEFTSAFTIGDITIDPNLKVQDIKPIGVFDETIKIDGEVIPTDNVVFADYIYEISGYNDYMIVKLYQTGKHYVYQVKGYTEVFVDGEDKLIAKCDTETKRYYVQLNTGTSEQRQGYLTLNDGELIYTIFVK